MLKYYYLDKHKQKSALSLNERVGEEREEEVMDLLVSDVEGTLDIMIKVDENELLAKALIF